VRWTINELTLGLQLVALKQLYPSGNGFIAQSQLVWRSLLTPSPLSQTYEVDVRYKLGESPKVYVLNPRLQERNGEKAPHIFPGGYLCLYYPKHKEWEPSMYLSNTIVPWTVEWLLHYEIWLATGEWCGGRIHLYT
jgi:hypothetical protein